MPQNTVFLPSGRGRVIVMDTPPPIPEVFVRLISLSMIRPTIPAQNAVLEKACVVYPNVTIDPHTVNKSPLPTVSGAWPELAQVLKRLRAIQNSRVWTGP